MSSRRKNLESVEIKTLTPDVPNASLLLDKYLEDQEKHKDQNKHGDLVKFVAELPVPAMYTQFYDRWVAILTAYGTERRIARVKGRMIVGLGDESVLETSVTLHHTYGVPYIPGSALKGLAASYVHHYLPGNQAWKQDGEAYKVIFGNTEDAGFITFFDALYIPDSGHLKQPLYPDTITVHHPKYYQERTSAPADWDSPTPIPFLSATGSYLVALAAPDLQQPAQWLQATFAILGDALKTMGIGAKTSSGYGRMVLEKLPVDPEVQKAEGYIREINALRQNEVASQIQGFYQRWQQLKNDQARLLLARAIVEKVKQAGKMKDLAEKAWLKTLLTFLEKA